MPFPQPSGVSQALLDGLYTELLGQHGGTQELLLLTRQRHLLTLSRQFVVHLMSLMSHVTSVCGLLEQSPPTPSLLYPVCLRLRQVTSHNASLLRRLRGDPRLYPSSVQDAAKNIHHALLLMAVKATLLTERLILRMLRRVARAPAEAGAELCRSLTAYNQVVDDLSKRAGQLAELQPFCLSRTLAILAEERGQALAGELCRLWSQGGLDNVLRREMETHMSHLALGQRSTSSLGLLVQEGRRDPSNSLQGKSQVVSSQRSPNSLGVIVQEQKSEMETQMNPTTHPNLRPSSIQRKSQVVPGQRSPSRLGLLLQEDRSQMTPVLHILAGLDQKTWNQVPCGSELALYSQYCSVLWQTVGSHVFHAVCPGMGAVPALPLLPERACASAVQILRDTMTSEDLPEPCVLLGHSLYRGLTCVRSLIGWDSKLCEALSSALTDKCNASTVAIGDPASGHHSRTSRILSTLCQHLSRLLVTPGFIHQSPPRNRHDYLFSLPSSELSAVTCQQGVLSRCAVSLHMCDTWLRGRGQIFVSAGSLSQLVLITHGDLPVIRAECRSLVATAENADWLPSIQSSWMKMKRSRDVLEGLVVSLSHVLASVCSRKAQDIFQHMTAGRHWRSKLVAGPDLAPSEYAEAAIGAVVVPVLDGVSSLCAEERESAVCTTIRVFMEAWMGHILREKIKFSLQGALQLRRDFEVVREALRCRESKLSLETVQTALALPVFGQADNAIVCLLQQPSRKAYLQDGGCAVFSCCPSLFRVAVDSMSDSLQSLDSLERRAWDGGVPGRVPCHSHDSYLPHNQRQWLSLRVHKTWNGLTVPWEGRDTSEG